jgi:ABC-2 type transport system permease protein
VLELAGVIFLVSLTFTVFGFLIAWQMDSTQGFHAVINLILFPLWLVSGAVFPMGSAHGWVRWLMRVNPVTYSVAALRGCLTSGTPELGTSLAVTAVCAAVLFIAATAAANRKSVN